MRNKKILTTAAVILAVSLLISACGSPAATPSPDMVRTNVAGTVMVQFTKTAQARPTETATPTITPTKTLIPVTLTPISLTQTPQANTTPQATTPAVIPGGQDAGVWARSNPIDGTIVDSGSKFTVVVTLLNTGTSTWSTDYEIRFVDGDQMGAPDSMKMPLAVPPQMSVDFTFEFTAPSTPGTVRSNWSIVNANGVAFGTFWCEYVVD
jgi:hypothetical protein